VKTRSFVYVLFAGWALACRPAGADASPLPGGGFEAARYEALWTKSPFSVSTPEAAPESPDYALVGVAEFDGVYYASLIDQKNQEHFLISTAKPARGLTLVSVTPGQGNTDTFAMVQRDGQNLTLKMQAASANPGPTANSNPNMPPVNQAGQPPPGSVMPMPGAGVTQPPIVRHRLPLNHLPPRTP
jgi:hypothetical protein